MLMNKIFPSWKRGRGPRFQEGYGDEAAGGEAGFGDCSVSGQML
jgi:hypothetical protein